MVARMYKDIVYVHLYICIYKYTYTHACIQGLLLQYFISEILRITKMSLSGHLCGKIIIVTIKMRWIRKNV